MKQIPQAVLDSAKELIDSFGEHFNRFGFFKGKYVYKFEFPKDMATGFPFVFLYDKQTNEVEKITGMKAMEVLSSIQLTGLSNLQ